ncbi:MAG: DUF177 domain-containing protein [Dehalococcoidia bacterium]|nr:DUF177 domain-containing protein [Dehalococcoidia bacterium]
MRSAVYTLSMMQFNVAHLLKGTMGTSQLVTLDAAFAPLDETGTSQVHGQIQLMHVTGGIWVSGLLDSNAVCTCSRCLKGFSLTLQLQLDEIYLPAMDIITGATSPLPEDTDPSFIIDDHHTLDLTEAVRQSAIVALPMKPLCRPDCAGLCPECGSDRNQVRCTCQSSTRDPRWESITRLLS